MFTSSGSAQATGYGTNAFFPGSCNPDCVLRGTRADIHLPTNYTLGRENRGLMRVFVEKVCSPSCGGGLAQSGGIQIAQLASNECSGTTDGAIVAFYEGKIYPNGAYFCDTGPNVANGTTLFRVQRTACSGNDCWAIWWNSTMISLGHLNMGSASEVGAGGEILDGGESTAVVKGTYGQLPGDTPWQQTATTYPNSPSWNTIQNAQCQPGSNWRVESPPSPFQIQFLPGAPGCF
jgi:hypothetical protein